MESIRITNPHVYNFTIIYCEHQLRAKAPQESSLATPHGQATQRTNVEAQSEAQSEIDMMAPPIVADLQRQPNERHDDNKTFGLVHRVTTHELEQIDEREKQELSRGLDKLVEAANHVKTEQVKTRVFSMQKSECQTQRFGPQCNNCGPWRERSAKVLEMNRRWSPRVHTQDEWTTPGHINRICGDMKRSGTGATAKVIMFPVMISFETYMGWTAKANSSRQHRATSDRPWNQALHISNYHASILQKQKGG